MEKHLLSHCFLSSASADCVACLQRSRILSRRRMSYEMYICLEVCVGQVFPRLARRLRGSLAQRPRVREGMVGEVAVAVARSSSRSGLGRRVEKNVCESVHVLHSPVRVCFCLPVHLFVIVSVYLRACVHAPGRPYSNPALKRCRSISVSGRLSVP